MEFEPISNISKITESIAYQYSESQNLKDYIEVLLTPFDELEQVFADILNKRMFATGTTHSLDIYGVILAQPREAYSSVLNPFFGLDASDVNNPVFHKGLGDLNNNSIGGIFRSIEQPVADIIRLSNEEYKTLLIGKEQRNNYKGGTEALIEAIKGVLECGSTGCFEIVEDFTTPEDPVVRIDFYYNVNELHKTYLETLNILPKPGGVRYEYNYL